MACPPRAIRLRIRYALSNFAVAPFDTLRGSSSEKGAVKLEPTECVVASVACVPTQVKRTATKCLMETIALICPTGFIAPVVFST